MRRSFSKLFAILCLAMGSLITACTPDQGGDLSGPPVLKVTGEAIVNYAVSVDIPIEAANLTQLAFLVEEYIINENGEEKVISGYNASGEPIIARDINKAPSTTQIFQAERKHKGKVLESVASLSNLHISGNEGLDKNKNFIVHIAAIVGTGSNKKYYTSDESLYPASKGEIFAVKFTTPEQYSDDNVSVIREHPEGEGLDIYVEFPAEVRARGNAIKWGVTDIATAHYNSIVSAEALYHHDGAYPAFLIKNDTLLEINHYNAYRRIKEGPYAGEIGYYDLNHVMNEYSYEEYQNAKLANENLTCEPTQYFYEFLPGTPMLVYFGEVAYCSKETGLEPNMGFSFGDGDIGWYWFPFNIEKYYQEAGTLTNPTTESEKYWYSVENGDPYDAWHRLIILTLPQPAKFDGNVNVEVSNLSTKTATITFSPDDRTYMYVVGILPNHDEYGGGFNDITTTFLEGREELWQWFSSSEVGYAIANLDYFYASAGMQEVKLEEYLVSLQAGGTYNVIVNAVGSKMDENGQPVPDFTSQNFQHIQFQLKNYTTPEPRLIVTPCESESPWKVTFNVKNPDYATNPIEKVAFAANYTRKWGGYMEYYGYTYTDMVKMNAGSSRYYLTSKDVILVNSEVGADVEFDVSENQSFTVAMMGWNTEGRPSNADAKDANGNYLCVAEATSLKIEAEERLESYSIIEALAGNWTASASIVTTDSAGAQTASTRTWNVSIGNLKSNEVLSEADYAAYEAAGVTREGADAYLAEYNALAEHYNTVKLAGQNRMLCQGWSLDDSAESTLRLASPWNLFTSSDGYNAKETENVFHDFGPKWYLQVREWNDEESGNRYYEVFVPVHYNRLPPLTRWTHGMDHFLCGYSPEANLAFTQHPEDAYKDDVRAAGFQVDVSEDGNTMTILPYTATFPIDDKGNTQDFTFYPNVVYDYYGSLYPYATTVTSAVVLTRNNGTVAPEAPATRKASTKIVKPTTKANLLTEYTTPLHPYSRTLFVPQSEKAKVTKVTIKKRPSPMELAATSLPKTERNKMVVSK